MRMADSMKLPDTPYAKIVDDGETEMFICGRTHAQLVSDYGRTVVAEYKLVKKVEYRREVVAVAEVR